MGRSRRKALIRELGQIFEAPPPEGKDRFLQSQRPPKLSMGRLLAVQASYLPKWVWLMFGGGFLAALGVGRCLQINLQINLLWFAGALVPFLVMASVMEGFRSMAYGMEELEMAARFSYSSILLARMGILGLGNLMWMLGVALMMDGGLLENVLYLMVPYLLTDFGCLAAVRRFRGREGLYACAGIAAVVCCLELLLSSNCSWIWEPRYLGWWLAAVAALFLGNLWEGVRTIGETEEYVWN